MLHNDSSESSSASTGATTMTSKSTRSTGSSSLHNVHAGMPNVWVSSPGPTTGQRGGGGGRGYHPASRASSMNGSRQRQYMHHQVKRNPVQISRVKTRKLDEFFHHSRLIWD